MSSERARQTIEPLLATPMTNHEILNQKVSGMRRLLIVVAVPILTVNFTHFLLHIDTTTFASLNATLTRPMIYMGFSIACAVIVLYSITWFSTGIGMRIHSQTKAVITAVGCLVVWMGIPIFLAYPVISVAGGASRDVEFIAALSPITAIVSTERYLIEPFLYGNLSNYSRMARTNAPVLILVITSIGANLLVLVAVWAAVRKLAPTLLQRKDGLPRPVNPYEPDEPGKMASVDGVTS